MVVRVTGDSMVHYWVILYLLRSVSMSLGITKPPPLPYGHTICKSNGVDNGIITISRNTLLSPLTPQTPAPQLPLQNSLGEWPKTCSKRKPNHDTLTRWPRVLILWSCSVLDVSQLMIVTLCVLEASDVVCIVVSGIPGRQYLGNCDPSSGAYNRTRSGCI